MVHLWWSAGKFIKSDINLAVKKNGFFLKRNDKVI